MGGTDGQHQDLQVCFADNNIYCTVDIIYLLAQSVLDPTAKYLGGVNQKRGNNRGENV